MEEVRFFQWLYDYFTHLAANLMKVKSGFLFIWIVPLCRMIECQLGLRLMLLDFLQDFRDIVFGIRGFAGVFASYIELAHLYTIRKLNFGGRHTVSFTNPSLLVTREGFKFSASWSTNHA